MQESRMKTSLTLTALLGTGAALLIGTAFCQAAPFTLAENGVAACTLIVSSQAPTAEQFAAKELAGFLNAMTGGTFAIATDSQPAAGREIVLGATNRLGLQDLPARLRPQKWEGFALYRNGDSLYILGAIPRATLYGVYDLLEVELGCRFLAPGVNHVPRHPTLVLDLTSRVYDPPMEYRSIWTCPDEMWLVRNRFNSRGEQWIPMEETLGGVRWINQWFVHTFAWLVPPEEFAATHPEYFALLDGKRQATQSGVVTQLCLTNPDVYEIVLKRVRGMVEEAQRKYAQAKYSKLMVSVSENDNGWFCQCDACRAVNREEGSPNGGTLMRFVNRIAREIGKDYPNVEIETLAYGMMPAPPKTKPEKNVVIRWARWIDNGYPLDSRRNADNWGLYGEIKGWRKVTDRIYHWGYYTNFGDYLAPFPHQNYLDHNIRVLVKNGVVGMFAQNASDAGAEFQQLRSYLLAKAIWRPETDGAKAQDEFCNLYYGKGAPQVLEYIHYLNDDFRKVRQASEFPDAFVAKANALLGEAETLADTPETKQRVATARLPIWKMMFERAWANVGKLSDLPTTWRFRFDADNVGMKEEWFKQTDFATWKPIKVTDWWTNQGETRRGIGWYGVEFAIPANAARPLALFFGAVDGDCDIFIDGTKVGEQKVPAEIMWNRPFSITLPARLAAGKHTMVLRVEKHVYAAGIWKTVSLSDPTAPVPAAVRDAAERLIAVGSAVPLRQLNEGGRDVEGTYYPLIEAFLRAHERLIR
jgi:hypothetical protein